MEVEELDLTAMNTMTGCLLRPVSVFLVLIDLEQDQSILLQVATC